MNREFQEAIEGQVGIPNRNGTCAYGRKSKASRKDLDNNYNNAILKQGIKIEPETLVELDVSNCSELTDKKPMDTYSKMSQKQKYVANLTKIIDSSQTLHNESDVSEDDTLVIADLIKSDTDMDVERYDEDGVILVDHNVIKNIEQQRGNPFLQSPSLNDFDIRCQSDAMSSTLNEYSSHRRLSMNSDDSLPIQAEAVMSDGSDDEEIIDAAVKNVPCKTKISNKGKDMLLEYLPSCFEWGEKCDKIEWQLNMSSLPPYGPSVDLPAWLKCTIPAKGYVCESCGDKFNIENSLIEHLERRSILVTLDCNYCKQKVTFHNRCAFKDHIKQHLLKGEDVNKTNTIIQPLPMVEIKLMQPIKISKYKQVVEKDREKRRVKKTTLSNIISKPEIHSATNTEDYQIKEDPVQCYMCNEYFENSKSLIHHLKTDQPWSDEKVECKKCRLVLPSLCSGKAHISIHSASTNEPSICPECGQKYADQREFVSHLNDCGHQFRKSGILCPQCNVCFFHFVDDFLSHWINEHCSKSYQCFMCGDRFETTKSHQCKFGGPQMPARYNYILNCPECLCKFNCGNPDEKDLRVEIKKHLNVKHSSIVNRVHYVFKSKFCCNAFSTKERLNIHHEEDHRKNNNFQSKNCSLFDKVQTYLQKYFNCIQERNSFVVLELAPILPQSLETRVLVNEVQKPIETCTKPVLKIVSSVEAKKGKKNNFHKPSKEIPLPYEKLKPVHCYQCGYEYSSMKDFKRHIKICKGAVVSLQCNTCNTNVRKEDFPPHCVQHIHYDLYSCIFCCGRPFESKIHLETHLAMHAHGQFIFPVTCIFCGFVMINIDSALEHVRDKHQIERIKLDHNCSHCGRKFHGSRGLMIHMKKCSSVVGNVRPILVGKSCKFCKRTIQPEVFTKHIIAHLEDGNLICAMCDGWLFDSSTSLLHHLEDHSHTLDFPSPCTICSFIMTDSNSCLNHLKDEHGFNTVKCPECDMSYDYWYMLQRHIGITHKACTFAKRRYICWICKAYDHVRKESVIKHFKFCHNLSIEEVNEQTDIRTRGFGSLPSDGFIPIKALGKKETPPKENKTCQKPNAGKSQISVCDSKSVTNIIKQEILDEDTYPGEDSYTNAQLPETQHTTANAKDPIDLLLLPEKDISQMEESPSKKQSNCNSSETEIKEEKYDNSVTDSPYKGIKIKFVFPNKDKKLSNKTKVVIKRMTEECSVVAQSPSLNKSDNTKKHFQCADCKFSTHKQSKLDKHIESHDQAGKTVEGFFCDECRESFVVKLSLERHLFFVHRIKRSSQDSKIKRINAKRSRSVDLVNKDSRKSKRRLSDAYKTTGKQLHCNVCKEDFLSTSELYDHLKTHGMSFLKMR